MICLGLSVLNVQYLMMYELLIVSQVDVTSQLVVQVMIYMFSVPPIYCFQRQLFTVFSATF